jgi:8-oxo-dGTP pyrophosphatase MutT (NUDIX family)
LYVPGGGIEAHESPAQAAVRETFEETGYRVRLLHEHAPVVSHYPFTWMAQHIEVTTHFFAAALIAPQAEPSPVFDASYLEGTHWVPLEDVPKALGFDGNILAAVLQLLPRE